MGNNGELKKTIMYYKKERPVSEAIHMRLMYHWALKEFLREPNWINYFKERVFPFLSFDRPYKNNTDDWQVDLLIRAHFDVCLDGFKATFKKMGKQKFEKALEPYREKIMNMAMAGVMEGRHK